MYGLDGKGAAGIMLEYVEDGRSKLFLKTKGVSNLEKFNNISSVIEKGLGIWPTSPLVEVGPFRYPQIFSDRAAVNWMLYLPQVLTVSQVPEARALIPVQNPIDGKQLGTIIVSVTDGVFDENNKEHVAIANSIEIRLADQDLLPRYVDL